MLLCDTAAGNLCKFEYEYLCGNEDCKCRFIHQNGLKVSRIFKRIIARLPGVSQLCETCPKFCSKYVFDIHQLSITHTHRHIAFFFKVYLVTKFILERNTSFVSMVLVIRTKDVFVKIVGVVKHVLNTVSLSV